MGNNMKRTVVISIKVPLGLVSALDELIRKNYFQNRSDAIREAIRRLVTEYRKFDREEFRLGFLPGYR